MSVVLLLVVLCIFPFSSFAAGLSTLIEKDREGHWSVSYDTTEPVNKIVFKRNPNDARSQRWTPIGQDIQLTSQQGKEFISRKDGRPFKQASFRLTPSYVPLPKEYAPFSPFSDGSMLFHSGRFFACIEDCSEDTNSWELQVKTENNERIIVGGKSHQSQVSWTAINSGEKVYAGNGKAIEGQYFVSMIDEDLPNTLKQKMSTQLPELVDFFENRLGALDHRPALYASYHDTSDGRYGHQGGTLPGQIFMHWYGSKAIKNVDSDNIYWFFAHEVAHVFQQEAAAIASREDAWVHEGAAEYFAGLASKQHVFQTKLREAKQSCVDALAVQPIYTQASAKKPKMHYSCGMLVMHALAHDLKDNHQSTDLFSLWRLFNQKIKLGKPKSARTFVDIVKPLVSEKTQDFIAQFSSNPHFEPRSFFSELVVDFAKI